MSQENQVTVSTSVQNLPVKRKRGRPRKDDSSLRRARKPPVIDTPRSDPVKRNPRRNTNSTSNGDDTMLGQLVSGVLDGSFDAGYLVTVKVGETNTVLRGVVFNPGSVLPISEANDVASNVKMFKRSEIPADIPSQLHGSVQRVEQKSQQTEKLVAALPLKVLPSAKQVSEVAPASPCQNMKGVAIDINQVPQPSPQTLRHAERSAHILVAAQVNPAIQAGQRSSQSAYSPKSLDTEMLQNSGVSSSTEIGGDLKGQAVDLNDTPVNAMADSAAAEPISKAAEPISKAHNSVAAGSQCVDPNGLPSNEVTAQPAASSTVKSEKEGTVSS